MTRDEVIFALCAIRETVREHINPKWEYPCDCICTTPATNLVFDNFSSTEREIDFIREAVNEKMGRERGSV